MQAGLFALLPQVVDAVTVPVIAAGGVADSRQVAAFMLVRDREVTALFAGQSAALTNDTHAAALVETLAEETSRRLRAFTT